MTDQLDRNIELANRIAQQERKLELPHLYSYKWYVWAKDFYDSQNKVNLLCAANQISKSSTQIRKCIHWATETSLWPELWPAYWANGKKPNQFWYLYPSKPVLAEEYETKWLEFLPKGAMKEDAKYGWEEIKKNSELVGIRFNSGVIVFFKFYSQKASDLQAASVFAMFCDEEMPVDLYDELMFRMNATDGYFHMVFTATLGQDFWRRAMEPGKKEVEELPGAWKKEVSLYDSMYYEDGTPSQWTEARISSAKAKCKSHAEVLKRIYGRFILVGGRKYEEFDASRHMRPSLPVPSDWYVYTGADPGSGGSDGHPAALCYVAVRPDFKAGRAFAGWRGDGIVTDNSATVRKHMAIKKDLKLFPVAQYYDWANKDFFIVASGMGETFIPADKSHDVGERTLNTLFRNDMLLIYETEELGKLAGELSTLKKDAIKRHASDDFADALRYTVTKIPWDFSGIVDGGDNKPVEHENPLTPMQQQCKERREMMNEGNQEQTWPSPEEEIEEWNDAYEGI